jgi:hypothetical protein
MGRRRTCTTMTRPTHFWQWRSVQAVRLPLGTYHPVISLDSAWSLGRPALALTIPNTCKPRNVAAEEVAGVVSCDLSPFTYVIELPHPISLSRTLWPERIRNQVD